MSGMTIILEGIYSELRAKKWAFWRNKMSALHFGNFIRGYITRSQTRKGVEPSDWTKSLEKYIPGAHWLPTNKLCNVKWPTRWTSSVRTVFFGSKKTQDRSLRKVLGFCCLFVFLWTPFICVKGELLQRIICHKCASLGEIAKEDWLLWQMARDCLNRRHKTIISHI